VATWSLRNARVELAGGGADLLVEQPLDEGVHVLVGGAEGGAVGEALGRAVEADEDERFFLGAQHAGATEGVGPGAARRHVLRPQPVIGAERAVEGVSA
jgi:hypothetical protein